jgi:hypothetical protein
MLSWSGPEFGTCRILPEQVILLGEDLRNKLVKILSRYLYVGVETGSTYGNPSEKQGAFI